MKKYTIMFKVTQDCNLNCKYCYSEHGKDCVTPGKFERYVRRALDLLPAGCAVDIVFHGGEPLLMSREFYDGAFSFVASLKEEGRKVRTSIQSNGTLLTGEMLDYFMANGCGIGLSLDGPTEMNLESRGVESEVVERALGLFKERGLTTGFIATVNRSNFRRLREVYDYFQSIGAHSVMFNMAETEDETMAVTGKEYVDALVDLFDYYVTKEGPKMVVKEFASAVRSLAWGQVEDKHSRETCAKGMITIFPDGSVSPCIRASDGGLTYGNLEDEGLVLQETELWKALERRDVGKGRRCKFYDVCHGGCFFSAHRSNGTVDGCSESCKMKLFKRVDEFLRDLSDQKGEGG